MALAPDHDARANMRRAMSCLRDAITEIEQVLARGEYDFAMVADTRLTEAKDRCAAAVAYLDRSSAACADLFRPTFDFLPSAAEGTVAAMGRAA